MKSLQNNLIYVVKSVNWILIPDTNLFVILDMLVGIKIVSKSGLGLDIKLGVYQVDTWDWSRVANL